MSAQFRTSKVRELRKRGKLKLSRGLMGALLVELGSFPRVKAMAAVTAMRDPAMWPINTPETLSRNRANAAAMVRPETMYTRVTVAIFRKRQRACRLDL